jgi:hypothetical protein
MPLHPRKLPALVAVGLLFAHALSNASETNDRLDAKFSNDFYASRPAVDAAREGMSDREQMLLSSFLLRVRLCEMNQKIWIHRGLTIRQAMVAEAKLLDQEARENRATENAICTLP